LARDLETDEFDPVIRKGLANYIDHFFEPDATPKYFDNRVHPIDAHCAAQSIITLIELKDWDGRAGAMACSVFKWAKKHLWNAKGYFYYQKLPNYTVKIPYMRWTQAWMLLALCSLLEALASGNVDIVIGA